MSKLSGLTDIMFYAICESEIGVCGLVGLFCFRIYCEGAVKCWLGLQVSLHEDLSTGFQSLQSIDLGASASAIYVLACHHYFLDIVLVTQGNSVQCRMGQHKSTHFRRRGLPEAIMEATTVTSIAVVQKSTCLQRQFLFSLRFFLGVLFVVAILQFHITYLGVGYVVLPPSINWYFSSVLENSLNIQFSKCMWPFLNQFLPFSF